MNTFNGNKFLDDHACTIQLSNGKEYVVRELPNGVMKEIDDLPDDASDTQLTVVFARFLGADDPSDVADIGVVETKGAINFLAENLLGSK